MNTLRHIVFWILSILTPPISLSQNIDLLFQVDSSASCIAKFKHEGRTLKYCPLGFFGEMPTRKVKNVWVKGDKLIINFVIREHHLYGDDFMDIEVQCGSQLGYFAFVDLADLKIFIVDNNYGNISTVVSCLTASLTSDIFNLRERCIDWGIPDGNFNSFHVASKLRHRQAEFLANSSDYLRDFEIITTINRLTDLGGILNLDSSLLEIHGS